MSAPGSFKWRSLRRSADAEDTWQYRRWAIALAGLIALIFVAALAYALTRPVPVVPEEIEPEKISSKGRPLWMQETVSYEPPPRTEEETIVDAIAPEQSQPLTEQRATEDKAESSEVDPAIMAARSSPFGEYAPAEEERFASGASGGGACTVTAGTAIQAEIDTAVISENISTVRAIVTNDVLGYGSCMGIPSGSVLVGLPEGAGQRHSKRMDIAFHTAVINGQSIDLNDAASADTMGRGGVPSKRNMHLASRGLAVAIATAVDLTRAALSGNIYGPVFGNNSGTAVERAANEALDRPTTLTVNPLERRAIITIVLNKSIEL